MSALHGPNPVGSKVTLVTRTRQHLTATVVFQKCEADFVDIAVLEISSDHEFAAFIPVVDQLLMEEDEMR